MRDENTSPEWNLFILAGRMQDGFKIYGKMQENRKSHIMNVTWRTATLMGWDWDMLGGASFIWPQILVNHNLRT